MGSVFFVENGTDRIVRTHKYDICDEPYSVGNIPA